jgi:hypothetical protein
VLAGLGVSALEFGLRTGLKQMRVDVKERVDVDKGVESALSR